jgi:hypothetical protein
MDLTTLCLLILARFVKALVGPPPKDSEGLGCGDDGPRLGD